MTKLMEHCDDNGLEHCYDKGMEHCDEKGMESGLISFMDYCKASWNGTL